MYSELKGKKLLVLGGSAWIDIIKSFTNQYGITVFTAGNDPRSPLAAAGEYHNINSTDHDEMKAFIRAAGIDGVYMGSNETVIRHALQYLEELGLPHYCTLTQWDALMNKRSFKNLCCQFGIPAAPGYPWTPENPCEISFPVVTKPADGCASMGITICSDQEELKEGYQLALKNSPSGEVLIEKRVNNSGMDVFFQITNGETEFCALGDKYPVQFEKGAGSVAGARVLPSLYTEEFRGRFEEKLKELFQYLGLRQGLIWMEVFHDGDQYYFNEAGFRPNGSLSIIGIDYLCGINTVAADIYYALTGRGIARGFPSLILKDVPRNKKKVCEYWVALHPGKIGSIHGTEALLNHPNVLGLFPKYGVGSVVPHTKGFAQNFCVIHFAYDNADEMKSVTDCIRSTIKVRDQQDNDMIIHKTDSFVSELIRDSMQI